MKLFATFSLSFTLLMTACLILFEINFDGNILVRLRVDWKTSPRPQPYLPYLPTQQTKLSKPTKPTISREPTKPTTHTNPRKLSNVNPCPKSPIAKADALGRLGNQIATYVNHIALQWEYGYQLFLSGTILTNLGNLLDNVTVSNTSELEHCNISYWPRAREWVGFTSFLAREKAKCGKERNVTFDKESFVSSCMAEQDFHINMRTGHNKPDWNLLQEHILPIKKYHLQINPNLKSKVQLLLKQEILNLQIQSPTFTGVHIRRGDFGGYTRFGHQMIDEKYYLAGMEYYRLQYPDTVFVLVSDDMDWCRQKFASSDVLLIGGNSPEEDLAILASCNRTLIGYGTFGVWGGFLAGGEVVVPESLKLFRGTASETAARVWNWTMLSGF